MKQTVHSGPDNGSEEKNFKPIIFVTGKGGVGKSMVSAAIALHLSSLGKKILLVELGEKSFFEKFFQLEKVDFKPLQMKPNFYLSLWDFKACLREYVSYYIKTEKLYDMFFGNQVMQRLIEAAPALKELAILGKATSGPRHVGPALKYDHIIIDSYSSGHHKALLKAPLGMSKMIHKGPMGVQSEKIIEVIKNKNLSQQIIVIKPEELPTVEGLELKDALKAEMNLDSLIVCNQSYDFPLSLQKTQELSESSKDESFREMAHFFAGIYKEQKECVEKIKNHGKFLEIPFVARRENNFDFIKALSLSVGAK